MLRFFLVYLLPLLALFLLYFSWHAKARRRARNTGGEPPRLDRGAVFWALLAWMLLSLAGLGYLAFTSGVSPDYNVYQSPRMENGQLIPPSFKKRE